MNRGDRHEGSGENSTTSGLPDVWDGTERDPYLPDGNVGISQSAQGTIIYDRDHPDRYLIGPSVEVEEQR